MFKETYQSLASETLLWVPKFLGVVVIIIAYVFVSFFLKHAIKKLAKRLELAEHLKQFLLRFTRVLLILLLVISVLGTLGINVTALVASLGLTGFAIGFALKDTISNLLSGILIMLYEPFDIGETINVAGFEGKVIAIDLRYTQLDSHGSKVLIPNSKLFTDPITVLNVTSAIEE